MKNLMLSLVIAAASSFLMAQKHDCTWILGYDGNEQSTEESIFGLSILEFCSDTTLRISSNKKLVHGYNSANTLMSDSNGEVLFSSNGTRVYDVNYKWMEGGENLNENESHGYILPQGVLALPHPKDSNIYAFFHGRKGYGANVEKVWYSEIDMRENEGLGKVMFSDLFLQDTLLYGFFTATKHGNGRDWWLLFQENCPRYDCRTDRFYSFLLTPDGVEQYPSYEFDDGDATDTGLGQAVFTPNGTLYLNSHSVRDGIPHVLDIYDFDRCSGDLSNKIHIEVTRERDVGDGGSGLAVSPNSRFAYLILFSRIIQFDLWASDIAASAVTVAEYDGFVQNYGNLPLATRFFHAQLALDGKIYINTTNSTQYLHIIHNPNEKGLACNVEQHGIKLPTFNGFSIPNHPNYQLGKWEDSPCDTLKDMVSTTNTFEKESIKLYPNPAFDVMNVELETSIPYKKMEVQVYDLLGKQLGTFYDTYSLPLDYPTGLYVVQIFLDNKIVKTEKLIIQQ